MEFEKRYYEQESLWQQEPLSYQLEVLDEIKRLIPEDVVSILDAGCGNGIICNNLDRKYDVTACDISEKALEFVKVDKKFVASIDNLPFKDSCFDLVMVNDVLEHLDEETYSRAISELRRVAKRYIIVVSPFMENLPFNYVRCRNCRREYHINLHKRSFDFSDFRQLIKGYGIKKAIFCGEVYQSTITPFYKSRHDAGSYFYEIDSICPFCGFENKREIKKDESFIERVIDSLEYSFLMNNYDRYKGRPDKQEIVLLYEKDLQNTELQNTMSCEHLDEVPINRLLFRSALRVKELKPFFLYPQFEIKGEYCFNNELLFVESKNGECASIKFSFPSSSCERCTLYIKAKVIDDVDLKLSVYDPLLNRFHLIKEQNQKKGNEDFEIEISRKMIPSRFGLLFELLVNGAMELDYIELKNDKENDKKYRLVECQKGYVEREIDGVFVSYRANGSVIIEPEWLLGLNNDYKISKILGDFDSNNYYELLGSFIKELEELISEYKKEIEEYTRLAEELEKSRAIAEESYKSAIKDISNLNNKIEELNGLLEKKEEERRKTEDAYQEALKEINLLKGRIEELNRLLEEKERERVKAEEVAGRYLNDMKVLEGRYNEINEKLNRVEEERGKAEDAYQEALREINLLKNRIEELNGLLEEKERERVKAEEVAGRYLNDMKVLEGRYNETNEKLNRVEEERGKAEGAYQEALKEINLLKGRIEELNGLLERKEKERLKSEDAYSAALMEISLKNDEIGRLVKRLEILTDEINKLRIYWNNLSNELNNKNRLIDTLLSENKRIKAEYQSRIEELKGEKEQILSRFEILKGKRVKRVLILSHMFPHRDQPVFGPFVLEQAKALLKYSDIDVRVISCRPFWMNTLNPKKFKDANRVYWEEIKKVKWEEWEGVKVLYPPYRVGGPFRFITHWHTYSQAVMSVLFDVWRDFKFDLVHAHTAYIDGSAAKAIWDRLRIPYIITEHMGPYSEYIKNPVVFKKIIDASTSAMKIVCVSPVLKSEVERFMNDMIRQKMSIIPNVINENDFKPVSTINRIGNPVRLIFIGSLEKVKNPLLVIRVVHRLKINKYNVKLTIVGKGPLMDNTKKLVRSLGLIEDVNFIESVEHSKIPEILSSNDILLNSSNTETFGVVIAEALSCGKPVVATRCGGPEYIINDERLGRIVDVDDEDEFYEAVVDVINNYERFDPIFMHNNIKERFGAETFVRSITDLYEEVVKL